MKNYRVNLIRSERAITREKLEHPAIEKLIGDFETIEEAIIAYNDINIGMEVEKQLINLNTNEVIETTY